MLSFSKESDSHPRKASKSGKRSYLAHSDTKRADAMLRHHAELGGQDEFVKVKEQFNIDAAKVKEKLKLHEVFHIKDGYDMRNLPKFDNLEPYGIDSETEYGFWSREVDRLVAEVNSTEAPSLYDPYDYFGAANEAGYSMLHKIALQLRYCLDIWTHDNELLLIEVAPNFANYTLYKDVHSRLLREFDPDTGKSRHDRTLRLEEHNDDCFHALVNYITGNLIVVLMNTMDGDFWTENCIAAVAKLSAKLKALVFDLPKAACISLEITGEVRRRTYSQQKLYSIIENTSGQVGGKGPDSPRGKQQEALQGDSIDAEQKYMAMMDMFHYSISVLMHLIVDNLGADEDSETAADVFETSVVVYEEGAVDEETGGVDRARLCSHRGGTIGLTADPGDHRCASYAANLCLRIWDSLPVEKPSSATWTSVAWKFTALDKHGKLGAQRSGSRSLEKMSGVITAFVPYSMVCGHFPSVLRYMSVMASLVVDPTTPIRYYEESRFLATIKVQTSAYLAKRPNLIRDTDVCSVSESPMAQKFALADGVISSTFRNATVGDKVLRDDLENSRRQNKEAMATISSWIIDDKAIVIPYRFYCWSVLGGCVILLLGGLAIGLSVGERIQGVDPFNISLFCWALAGFLVLFFKSIRVENWPWRDFLLGRVVCRSVSEVAAVSGMKQQVILTILLRLERKMNLTKRGPYQGGFDRIGEDGFSIDEPISQSTITESGRILIKVQSIDGPALVILRAPRRIGYSTVTSKGSSPDKEGWVCRDFLDPDNWMTADGTKLPLYSLCTNELRWIRVLGIFKKESRFG